MVRTIPRRGCAALLAMMVGGLVGLVGATPAAAATVPQPLTDSEMLVNDGPTLSRVGPGEEQVGGFPLGVTAPKGVALSAAGTLYVAGTLEGGQVVAALDSATNAVSDNLFPGLTTADDVAVDTDGTVYLADAGGKQLAKLTSGGSPETLVTDDSTPIAPDSVAVRAGTVYFADSAAEKVYAFGPTVLKDVASGVAASDLVVDADGVLYIADATNNAILRLIPSDVTTVEPFTEDLPAAPAALALDDKGTLYVSLVDGSVHRVGNDGTLGAAVVTGLTISAPEALAVRRVPAAPQEVTAVAGDQKATISWKAAATNDGADVKRYIVATYVNTEDGGWVPSDRTCDPADALTCEVTGLVNGTEYMFSVRAANTVGSAIGWSPESKFSTVTEPHVSPAAPGLNTPVPGNGSASLTLIPGASNGTTITGYQVSTDEVTWRDVADIPAADDKRELVVTDLPNGQSTTLHVRAVAGQTGGGTLIASPSEAASVTPDSSLPGIPANLSVQAGDKSAVLTVTAPAQTGDGTLAGYEASVNGGAWEALAAAQDQANALGDEDTQTFTIDGLTNGQQTWIRVRAKNSNDKTGVYVAKSVTPAAVVAPAAPTDFTLEAGDKQLTVRFTAPAGATAYQYRMDIGSWTTLTTQTQDGKEVGYLSGLTNGQTYEVWVRGTNAAGPGTETGSQSATPKGAEPTATTSSPTATPTTTKPTTTPATTTPTTTPATTKPTTTPATTTPTTTPATTTPTTTPATTAPTTTPPTTTAPTTPPTTTPATTAPTTTPPTTTAPTTSPTPTPTPTPSAIVPAAPTGVTATAGVGSITVSWNASAANGAEITGYRATTSGGGSCTTSGETTCVVGGNAGTSYTVTVVALSAAGTSPASAPSNAVTPTALDVPATPPVASAPLETPDGPVTAAAPGQTLTMRGSGYAPFSVVTLAVYSEPRVLGTVTADANGEFETEIAVPDNLSLGKHSFVAAGVDENGEFRALRLDLTVAHSSDTDDGDTDNGDTDDTDDTLPVTGSATVLWMIVAGFASVVTGVAVRKLV